MSKTLIEKIILTVVSPLIVFGAIAVFTNIGNAASIEDLDKAKIEVKNYTDKAIKTHEDLQDEQIKAILEKISSVETSSKNTNDVVNKLLDIELNK